MTLSVPYSLTRNKMPMAVDVVNFLHTYASSAASTQAEIKNRYGLSRFEETIERHLLPSKTRFSRTATETTTGSK